MSTDYGYDVDAPEDSESGLPVPVEIFDGEEGWDTEKMLHTFPQEELSIILLKHLGFKPKEITRIMGLRNIGEYYALRTQLKKSYRIKLWLLKTRENRAIAR